MSAGFQLSHLPWWPSWLDRGALINAEAPGCGTSVVCLEFKFIVVVYLILYCWPVSCRTLPFKHERTAFCIDTYIMHVP